MWSSKKIKTQDDVIVNLNRGDITDSIKEYVLKHYPDFKDYTIIDVDLSALNTQGEVMGVDVKFRPRK